MMPFPDPRKLGRPQDPRVSLTRQSPLTANGLPNVKAMGMVNQFSPNRGQIRPPLPFPGQNPGGRPNPMPNPFPVPGNGQNGQQPAPPHQIPGGQPGPQTGPIDPNAFLAPDYTGGRSPMDHLRYWANQGYAFQPGQAQGPGQFVQDPRALYNYLNPAKGAPYNGPQLGGRPNPMQGQPNPGQTGGPVFQGGPVYGAGQNGGGVQHPGPQGGPDGGGNGGGGNTGGGNGGPIGGPKTQQMLNHLPLDPQFILGKTGLLNQKNTGLASIAAQRANMEAALNLGLTRLGNDQTDATNSMQESQAARGIFGSGAAGIQGDNLAAQFDRQRQNMAFDNAQGMGDLRQQALGLRSDYRTGLMGLLQDLAQRWASDPNAPVLGSDRSVRKKTPKKKGGK